MGEGEEQENKRRAERPQRLSANLPFLKVNRSLSAERARFGKGRGERNGRTAERTCCSPRCTFIRYRTGTSRSFSLLHSGTATSLSESSLRHLRPRP